MPGSFPADFPAGCPPEDAAPASSVVFRIVKAMPPQAADFLTHRESGRMPDADPCLRSGLSVFGQRPDAVHQAQLFPRLGRHIAVANLRPEHGFTRLTRGKFPSHSTWWVHVGVDRASLFSSSGEVR